jgi:hypothetical protein
MKNDEATTIMEKTPMQLMHDALLRELIKGKPPYEKLEIIRRETGLERGREVLKFRQLDSAGYEEYCKARQPERHYSGNARMGGFTFRQVHA